MFRFLVIAIVFIFASCGKNSSDQSAAAGSCTSSKPGFLCLSGQPTPQLDGMCSQTSDCPPPYNFCDTSNRCQVQATQPGSNQIWFATDPIRPGINAGDAPGPSGTGYIYNIMAKGYESLDDWCMSQAQLTSIPAMRRYGSWKALVVAQPDRNGVATGTQPSSEGQHVTNSFGKLAWFGGGQFIGPGFQAIPFSTQNNNIQDRSGISVPNANQFRAWSGLYRAHSGYTSLMCIALANSKCVGGNGGDSNGYWGICGYWDSVCSDDSPGSQSPMDGNTVWWGYQCGTTNAWSSSGNPSGPPTEYDTNNNGGIFALTPSNCSPTPGFDFLVTCNYDSTGADLVGSFCSNSYPVLCLSN